MHPDLKKVCDAMHKAGIDLTIIIAVLEACVRIGDYADTPLVRKIGTMSLDKWEQWNDYGLGRR